jgi:hypothetical protein
MPPDVEVQMDDDSVDRAGLAKRGSPYLNTDQAAHFLGCSRRHLQRLRARGTGPLFRLHSRIVQYHIDDLLAWSKGIDKRPQS